MAVTSLAAPTGARRLLALAVAVALLLAANAAVVVLDRRDGQLAAGPGPGGGEPVPAAPLASEPPTTVAPPPTTTAAPAPATALERRVAELSAFVADARELDFLRPVPVQLLDDEAFVERLLRDVEENREDTDQIEKVLRAMQLIEPGVDLFESYLAYYGNAVLGFYDPETDELVLRGVELNPYVEVTLVHELTHALEDQHFELDRPDIFEADDERALGFSSLIEGVALTVESAYRATLSDGEREAADREAAAFSRRAGASPIPAIITSLSQFPYLAGPFFVAALLEEGAEDRVNAAYADPPATSEQILDPGIYLRGEQPVAVPPPPAGGAVINEGSFGEWAVDLTLRRHLDSITAGTASDGWGGDSYVAWDEGERTCVRLAFAMDTPADLGQLDGAWRQWARAHGDATVETTTDLVTVTACG
ncbi:MAG TPA: hypothetical protein VNT56_12435 [Acidimicrobiales bacterium]|nr:hypothetical protein [Acidimicrobiales bacterium]